MFKLIQALTSCATCFTNSDFSEMEDLVKAHSHRCSREPCMPTIDCRKVRNQQSFVLSLRGMFWGICPLRTFSLIKLQSDACISADMTQCAFAL